MQNLLFYCLTVMIWGSTWLAIKFQLGLVDPMVSVAYRFMLASALLLVFCLVTRRNLRFKARDHGFMLLQGSLLFGFNYWLFYVAELHLTSGLAAVVFSLILAMNVINGAIFLRSPVDLKVVCGGVAGLCGIMLVFRPELAGFDIRQSGPLGMVICVGATYLASLGNILSARNQRHGLPIVQTNAFGMAYGACLMAGVAWLTGKPFTVALTPSYLGALVYLALFGSVIAFGCYLTLIGRIGADRAAYATLLFPVVALVISSFAEGYHWTVEAIAGVALILAGNLLIIRKKAAADRPVSTPLVSEPATET